MRYAYIILMLILLCGCRGNIYDLTICDSSLIQPAGRSPFIQSEWLEADQAERGKMVGSLAVKHWFIGRNPQEVEELLGERTCYVNYDDEPCYRVIVDSETKYIAFTVAHSGENVGKITGAYLRDNSSLFGCIL